MAIASEITRISNAKSDIKSAIEAKGVTVPSNALIDTYDDYVAQISGGGGNKMGQFVDVDPSATYSGTFDYKNYIESVTIPSGFTGIPQYGFQNLSVKSVTIPSTVTSIAGYAFSNCTSLKGINSNTDYTINIPDSVTTMGTGVLSTGNFHIHIGSGLTTSFTSYNQTSFQCDWLSWSVDSNNTVWNDGNGSNCLIHTATNQVIHASNATTTIPSGVTGIADYAFRNVAQLSPIITVADSVSTIGEKAFVVAQWSNARYLDEIHLGSGITSIGNQAFNIPYSRKLHKLYITATTPPTLTGSSWFGQGINRIYVPASSVEDYKAASGWSNYASIIAPIGSEIYNFDFKAQRQALGTNTYIPVDTTTVPITIGGSTVNAYPCTGVNVGLYVGRDDKLQLTNVTHVGLQNKYSSSVGVYFDNLQAGDEIILDHFEKDTSSYPDISYVSNLTKVYGNDYQNIYEVTANGAIGIYMREGGWIEKLRVNRPTTA